MALRHVCSTLSIDLELIAYIKLHQEKNMFMVMFKDGRELWINFQEHDAILVSAGIVGT